MLLPVSQAISLSGSACRKLIHTVTAAAAVLVHLEGGRIMLIDMGGGTVDMTVHDIDSLAGGEAMSMSEATHRECLAEVREGR